MAVHYKFKNTLHYDAIKFDGIYISTAELKNTIIQQKKLVKGDSDLKITNEETGKSYTDDQLIPKNTSLIISRVPFPQTNKRARDNNVSQSPAIRSGVVTSNTNNNSNSNHSKNRSHPYRFNNNNNNNNGTSSYASNNSSSNNNNHRGPPKETLDNNNYESMTDEEKMKQIHLQSTRDYDPTRYARGGRGGHNHHINYPLPPGYSCHRCGLPGHHIKNCTSNFNHKVKLSSGIPRSFMIPSSSDVKGAMMTQSGEWAVPYIDHEAYKEFKKEKAPFLDENNDNISPQTKPEVPDYLQCGICSELLSDAVLISCCKNKFCDDCIRTKLIESEAHECPVCKTKGVSPDSLISSSFWRREAANYNGHDASNEVDNNEDMLDKFTKFLKSQQLK